MTAYQDFTAAYHDHFTRNPNTCVRKGVDRHLDELPDPSLAGSAANVAEARALLTRLDELPAERLSFDEELDLDLARLSLESQVHLETVTFNGATHAQQLPTAGSDIGDGLFYLLVKDPRPAGERLADMTARIAAIPDYVESLLGRLATPVARWADVDRQKVDELPGFLASLADWADAEGWSGRAGMRSAIGRAEAALSSYLERLAALPTTEQLHLGPSAASRIVELKGIDKSLDDLHAMARDFLAETNAILEELRGRLVGKYGLDADASQAELQARLAERYAVPVPDGDLDAILARYEQERTRILAFITERDLFPIFPGQDMQILRTPKFMEPSIPAGAMDDPTPFREGVKTSIIYLTLREDLLDEHTELSIPGMMIHEGIPGHHLQLATAATHPSIVRRHVDAMEHAEGWTTYLEDYMLDVGYMGDLIDEARFVGKRDISRIGARVAIDLFFMTGEKRFLDVGVPCDLSSADPFVAAGNLLTAVTGFVPSRVQAELNWYSAERGYPLSYLTGNRMVWELKRDVAAANQSRSEGRLQGRDLDRRFHEVYLQSGCMPVSRLRRVFAHEGLLG